MPRRATKRPPARTARPRATAGAAAAKAPARAAARSASGGLLATLIANLPSGVLVEDPGRRILHANAAFCAMFGVPGPPEALAGADCAAAAEGVKALFADPDGFAAGVAARVRDGVPVRGEVLALADGRVFERDYVPLTIDGRRGHLWHYRDATEPHRAAGELRRTLSLLGATLDSTADGILVVDRHGKVAGHNRTFATMWGIPDEVMASGDDDRLLAFVLDRLVDPGNFLAKVRELYAAPLATSFDVLRFKDGRVFERSSRPQLLEGEAVGRVWSFRDVTERHRAEAERLEGVRRAQELERLRELDRFKTQFINTAAHELGTPLTPIKLQVHLLRERGAELGPAHRRALEVLDRNVDRLGELVEDILEVARLQGGQLGIAPRPVDLGDVVREATAAFEDAAPGAGIALEVRAPAGVGVAADPKRLTQVLLNLLNNAWKFTGPGGRVTVEVAAEGDEGVVRVRDTGIGIAAADLPRLFQPFSQVHDTLRRPTRGTGLGLFISRSIVEQHGGRIWAESPGPGHGATFAVALPAAPLPAAS